MKFLVLVMSLMLATPAVADIKLIGGTVTDQAQWTASGFGRSGNAGCSYTVVGERVVLTAAHCVSDGGTFSFSRQGVSYSAVCTHHPQYSQAAWEFATALIVSNGDDHEPPPLPVGATEDWSLCVTNAVVQGVTYEVVETDPAVIGCQSGKVITLSGYGCTRWGGSIDGQFRTGTAPAVTCPSSSSQDLVTRGTSALCSGDSGGGAYVVMGDGRRLYVGTNSRSNTTTTSYLSSTFAPKFKSWALSWAQTKSVVICGLHAAARGCRGGDAPDPDPEDCTDEMDAYLAALAVADTKLDALRACVQ